MVRNEFWHDYINTLPQPFVSERKPTMKVLALAGVALALLSSSALANSVKIQMGLNGSYGGNGGYHVLVIDGQVCRLKNSTFGNIPGGQPQGCNYTISDGMRVRTKNYGCSKRCE